MTSRSGRRAQRTSLRWPQRIVLSLTISGRRCATRHDRTDPSCGTPPWRRLPEASQYQRADASSACRGTTQPGRVDARFRPRGVEHLSPRRGGDRIGKTLQRCDRAAHTMVGLVADARIEQYLQAGPRGHIEHIHFRSPRTPEGHLRLRPIVIPSVVSDCARPNEPDDPLHAQDDPIAPYPLGCSSLSAWGVGSRPLHC